MIVDLPAIFAPVRNMKLFCCENADIISYGIGDGRVESFTHAQFIAVRNCRGEREPQPFSGIANRNVYIEIVQNSEQPGNRFVHFVEEQHLVFEQDPPVDTG